VIKKKDLSQEDKKAWEDYIKDPSDIFDKDKKNQKNVRKDRFTFDLHGFTLLEANNKVREIIIFCIENKYKELLLITGKGIHSTNEKDSYVSKDFGRLKFSVPEFIKSDYELNKLIISVSEAAIKDGGEGAILIKLKNL
jgi:DNA-nicking Smr family endonuclease